MDCDSVLSGGERIGRAPAVRGDWGGGGKDEAGAGSAAYDVGDDA